MNKNLPKISFFLFFGAVLSTVALSSLAYVNFKSKSTTTKTRAAENDLTVTPTELTFEAYKGEAFSTKQLTISGDPASPIDWTTSTDSSNCDTKGMPIGITFSPRDGRTTASVTSTVTAQANTSPAGSCFINATIKPSATGSSVTPITVKLNINIKEPSSLEVNKSSLSFSSVRGTNPPCQAFDISKSSGIDGVSWGISTDGYPTWLSDTDASAISPFFGNTGTVTQVKICPQARYLTVGDYSTILRIMTAQTTVKKEVAITLSVTTPAAPLSQLIVIPATIDLDLYRGESTSLSQPKFTVTGSTTTPVSWEVTVNKYDCTSKNLPIEVVLIPTAGNTRAPKDVLIDARPGSSPTGTCTVTATFAPSTAEGAESITAVSAQIFISIKEPSLLVVSPTILNFSTVKGTNPPCKTLTVSKSSGLGGIPWGISTDGYPTWLSDTDASAISPFFGNTNNPVQVQICPQARYLTLGDYSTTLRIMTAQETVKKEVAISLTVTGSTPPPPTGTTLNLKTGWNKISWLASYGYLKPATIPQGCVVSGKYNNWFGDFLYNFGVNIYWPAQSGDLYVRCKSDVTWTL
jgi:hypothetical protein